MNEKEPPNFREAKTCFSCNHSEGKEEWIDHDYTREYLICKKYKKEIEKNEIKICDDHVN